MPVRQGREPDVVDTVVYGSGYALYSTWLDDDKVTVAKSIRSYTSSDKSIRKVAQYTLSRRTGRMRFFGTARGIWEGSSPYTIAGIIKSLAKPTQLLVSGHLYDYFCTGNELAEMVIKDMWPMLPADMWNSIGKIHPAFRRDDAYEFMERLVGFADYNTSAFIDQNRRDINLVNVLQSVPKPHTAYDYRDLLDLLKAGIQWRQVTPNTRRLSFDHGMTIIKHGMPPWDHNYGALDLTGHMTLQSAFDAAAGKIPITTASGGTWFTHSPNKWFSLTGTNAVATVV